MYSRSDNINIMINDKADEVLKEISKSLKNRYQLCSFILLQMS